VKFPAKRFWKTSFTSRSWTFGPIKRGHTLVVPKREIDYMFDMDDLSLGNLWAFAKKVAKPLREAIPCQRVGDDGGGPGSAARPHSPDPH
jgi:diadenosine tetraphosphate (Ap4A) HIT family hydrolase